MKAYKGFKKKNGETLMCHSFIYEEGKTYETDKAKLCECGFHDCLDHIDYHKVENEGIAKVRKNGEWFHINTKGEKVD